MKKKLLQELKTGYFWVAFTYKVDYYVDSHFV